MVEWRKKIRASFPSKLLVKNPSPVKPLNIALVESNLKLNKYTEFIFQADLF